MQVQTQKQNLSEKEVKGFVSLLQDSEDNILSLMAQQLLRFDDRTLRAIESKALDLADDNDDEELIDNWYYISKIALLEQIQEWKKNYNLEKGMLLVSRLKNAGLEEEKYTAILDNFAARVKAKLNTPSRKISPIDAINEVLFKEEAFVGNQVDYYDINNNFLHTVLDYRTGNPIMLSTIYILVARRVGADIRGVGTPGHFIVQYEDRYYDPFFAGREISREECVLRAQELNVHWRDEYLDEIDDKQIMSRCIRNLIAIYKKLQDYDKAEDATSILRIV